MNADLIVIILTYNHKDSISKCIESVLKQKTAYKYEIHICDDASTDGTTEICKQYAEKFPNKIKLFLQEENTFRKPFFENHLYKAMKRINSRYWSHLDGDDYWISDKKIDIALKALDDNNDCMVFAHNTILNNTIDNTKDSFICGDVKNGKYLQEEIKKPHASARIYRTINEFIQNPIIFESRAYYFHLMYGSVYFYNENMSVYNYNGDGIWSSLSLNKQKKISKLLTFQFCIYDNFKYEKYWLKQMSKKDKTIIKALKIFLSKELAYGIYFTFVFLKDYGFEAYNFNCNCFR